MTNSLRDRILALAHRPSTMTQLIDSARAGSGEVVKAVKQLVKDGHLSQSGEGHWTIYQTRGGCR